MEPATRSAGAKGGAARRGAGYELERQLRGGGAVVIAGVDEVGRGAWAGPVLVCAAVTDLTPPPELPGRGGRTVRLTDSKLLTRAHREAFAEILPNWLSCHAFGEAGAAEIDEVGMTEALRRATERALAALPRRPDVVILDGAHDFLRRPAASGAAWRVRCEVKADQRSVTVAAASVLAKVRRDRLMGALGADHPAFGFADNAGYPSPQHQQALASDGPTPHHRLSWSYLDDLPQWRHLKKTRSLQPPSGQLTLL
ncbi:ribonuclease HII [Sphaerisporangium album]|uniref:ribonuclease HII n=1 Tax=Sphaerisporangium album TaxID=509200 RepID=UPI001FE54DCD|nr:ribonuclease HII [Sphaerisporangium album]